MKSALLVVGLMQAGSLSTNSQASADPFDQYRSCIQTAVIKYERAAESASDTVDAALSSCRSIRNQDIRRVSETRPANPTFSAKQEQQIIVSIWDKAAEVERGRALESVFDIRLRRRVGK